ncbi:hypothetical protein RSAG8_07248, partial [Rhizoctonia solani AG-8 WAC10335]
MAPNLLDNARVLESPVRSIALSPASRTCSHFEFIFEFDFTFGHTAPATPLSNILVELLVHIFPFCSFDD